MARTCKMDVVDTFDHRYVVVYLFPHKELKKKTHTKKTPNSLELAHKTYKMSHKNLNF